MKWIIVLYLAAATGCASGRARPADIDMLTGAPWVGTLTYLDYSSHKPVTIDSNVTVRRTGDDPPAWEFGMGYAKEPHADKTEVIVLRDGMLGDERMVSRRELDGGGVMLITEADGRDDDRPARFRFEYTIAAHEYTRRKLVRFDGESEFFERHIYWWRR